MAAQISNLAHRVQQVVSKITTEELDPITFTNVDRKEDHLLGVRNTFVDLSDSPSLHQWYKDIRGIRSCPVSEHGDDRSVCGDAHGDEDNAWQTPEPSPRSGHEEEKPQVSAPLNATKAAEPRTPLKSGASPYRPTVARPSCSTTYYATPPPVGARGPFFVAEYHGRVQASSLHSQVQDQQISATSPTYLVADHRNVTRPCQSGPPVLGSEALPSIGSGAHATGECRPCAFFHKNRCVTGRTCLFCHLCDAGERKRRLRLQKVKHAKA
ncbi:unnamed protein product [Symbiodinium sp. CCMP2592]|nr:unnamed protein product [Symbiodinium sp. CCMP2592]